jgi:predicted CopG family antitoxin
MKTITISDDVFKKINAARASRLKENGRIKSWNEYLGEIVDELAG